VLLLHGFDPARPDDPYWFTIGGGAEPGVSLAQPPRVSYSKRPGQRGCRRARRTGLARGDRLYYDGTSYRQEQDFFELRIGSAVVMTDGLDDEEAAVIDGHRWWTVAELEATTEMFYPPDLPGLLRELAGRTLGAS
jgi:hypothetical protein